MGVPYAVYRTSSEVAAFSDEAVRFGKRHAVSSNSAAQRVRQIRTTASR